MTQEECSAAEQGVTDIKLQSFGFTGAATGRPGYVRRSGIVTQDRRSGTLIATCRQADVLDQELLVPIA